MKILITNSYYFPAFVGGAEISVKLLAEGLASEGHDVYVLTTGVSDKVYRVNGVVVISIKQQNIFNSYLKQKRSQAAKIAWHLIDSFNIFYHHKISAILKRIKPDLVHTNSIQGFSPVLWYTIKKLRIPLVHSTRDYYMLCHKCNMYNGKNCESLCAPCKVTHAVKKNFFKYPDHIIGISNFILDKYQSYHPALSKKSSLIYNAVETTLHLPAAKSLSSKVVFGYIGRLELDKGVAYLAEEVAALAPEEKALVKIILAGKGDEEFIRLLKEKFTGVEVEFLGVVKPANFYSKINVLLVPALWNEPFGRIVIESLSYSVPVCQSDRGGLKELYNAETSWLFSPLTGNLTHKIGYILANQGEITEKRKSCIDATQRFSVNQYITKHLELYHKFVPESTNSEVIADSPLTAYNVIASKQKSLINE